MQITKWNSNDGDTTLFKIPIKNKIGSKQLFWNLILDAKVFYMYFVR